MISRILQWLHIGHHAPAREEIPEVEDAEREVAASRVTREAIKTTAARLIRDSADEATRQRSIRASYTGNTGNWVETEIFGGYSAERDRG